LRSGQRLANFGLLSAGGDHGIRSRRFILLVRSLFGIEQMLPPFLPEMTSMIVSAGSGIGPNISEKMIAARAALTAKSPALADAAFGA
jgi:hypothetical protein